jgi:hypothetical protein
MESSVSRWVRTENRLNRCAAGGNRETQFLGKGHSDHGVDAE